MDLSHSTLGREARAVEVYQARRACLISYSLLAFLALLAYTVVLLLRCGAADDDDEQ